MQLKLRELIVRWNALSTELSLACFDPINPAHAITATSHFTLHKNLQKQLEVQTEVVRQSQKLLPTWTRWNEIEESTEALSELRQILANNIKRHQLENAWSHKEQLLKTLGHRSGRVVDEMRLLASSIVGDPDVPSTAIQEHWSKLLHEVKRIHSLRSAFADVAGVCARIAQSGAEIWAMQLRTNPASATVDLLLPNNWKVAWRLRQLATYLEQADPKDNLKKLGLQRREAEKLLAKAYEQSVTTRTWLKLADNATPDIRAALEAFRTAIAKIGKGTGKRSVRYRQDARKAATRSNRAIPCWIMPHWRISESLPAEFGCFDLVIIDEASQSDLSALPALLRAKKVLIVGDDKQVSPEGVGLEEEKIRAFMARCLKGQVDLFRAQMTPERSMYDLFKVVFAESSIMLKEHFRCVGPIIEYSKREVYNHELKPIRIPKASERLDPPLIDILVEDGFRGDDKTNSGEARYIVDEIKRICANPSMSHRTIGVVSLLGSQQAVKIWEMLESEVGPELMTRHNIACGDARIFQGKERDIVFLSMVVSQNKVQAETKDSTAQRYNVAASRARDRMYLVRSIELEELSQRDILRRQLISHFAKPFAQDEKRVEDLRRLCESDFEREIYDLLIERGYRVTPQVKVGAYRIDIVVEGANDSSLAIECDGDQYHGIDQWEDDMNRQRLLERVGWRFWRCFASMFVKNRTVVIENLVNSLTEQGITPSTGRTATKSIQTDHRRVTAFALLGARLEIHPKDAIPTQKSPIHMSDE